MFFSILLPAPALARPHHAARRPHEDDDSQSELVDKTAAPSSHRFPQLFFPAAGKDDITKSAKEEENGGEAQQQLMGLLLRERQLLLKLLETEAGLTEYSGGDKLANMLPARYVWIYNIYIYIAQILGHCTCTLFAPIPLT